MTQLTQHQTDLITRGGSLFLEGGAGTGKTTVAVQRMRHLLDSGIPADSILVLVPHRTLALPYQRALRSADIPPGGQVTVTTLAGIAIRAIELFWALAASKAGFAPDVLPTFLSLETSQYIMARVIGARIDESGYFESVTIDRSRLYSEIIDNLNKAAVVGFPPTEIGDRLKAAWLGDTAQNRLFEQVQDAASRYRAYLLQHNLLDFALQMDIFANHLWREPACRNFFMDRYTHIIADNIEEDNPLAHDILRDWLPQTDSALLVYDSEGGYRTFLGADPDNAYTLRAACDTTAELEASFVTSPDVYALANELGRALDQYAQDTPGSPTAALNIIVQRYYPDMLEAVAAEIIRLVRDEAVPPAEIAVVAPTLPDSLRFTLLRRLEAAGVPARTHRPSRALREEPAARCLLTLAQLAHPVWGAQPAPYDVAYALMQAIATIERDHTLDLVRAQLLADNAYPHAESKSRLAPFDSLPADVQERVTYVLGERYDALRGWLEAYITRAEAPPPPPKPKKGRRKKQAADETAETPAPELDYFFSLIFGEVLSQRGFGFYNDDAAADATSNLVESAYNFRRAIAGKGITTKPVGQEYSEMVAGGLIAAQYMRHRQQDADSVLIAPAYTFLMNNAPVAYQFWIDVGSRRWFERLYQPLTHPYVLSRQWNPGEKWTDDREQEVRREALYRLVTGLTRRCRSGVYLGISELGENGYESQGELLTVFNRLLRRHAAAPQGDDANV